ncbi:restriction endonuclease subunit S [Thioclava sp.]|uniref:restriction endonuclease subunit S n=1 Tax=Thioclava sp. TaxID=1933450 RepID=UPI003241CC8C
MKDVIAAKPGPVGEVPEGWSKTKVAHIASIITGPFGTLLKASEYGGAEGVPLISVGEVREGFLRVTDETPTVSQSVTKRLPQYLLREGDVVFGRKGGVERSAIIKDFQAGWFLGSDGISIRLKDGYHRPFFGQAFRSGTVQSWLLQNASGTTMPSLNQAILGAVEIPFPNDPKEQEAIAEALSDADALIEGLERLIAKKRLIKQGAMQDLLTAKRRLPGFSGEWVDTPLGEIGPFVGGGTPSMARADFWKDGTIPWVSSSDIRIGELHSADRMITVDAVKGSSTRVVGPGSILFVTRSGILRRFQPVMINTVPVAINQDIKALLPRSSEYSAVYVFHAAVGAGDQILRDCMKTGTTVESIDLTALRRFCVSCPKERDEQDAIATVLTDIDAEIQALNTRLEKARQVKEGMMQNLLTGRIRLV